MSLGLLLLIGIIFFATATIIVASWRIHVALRAQREAHERRIAEQRVMVGIARARAAQAERLPEPRIQPHKPPRPLPPRYRTTLAIDTRYAPKKDDDTATNVALLAAIGTMVAASSSEASASPSKSFESGEGEFGGAGASGSFDSGGSCSNDSSYSSSSSDSGSSCSGGSDT